MLACDSMRASDAAESLHKENMLKTRENGVEG